MSVQKIETSDATAVELFVSGDLALSSGGNGEVTIHSDDDTSFERRVELANGVLTVNVGSDARVRVPRHLEVRVARANGDVRARDLGNRLTVDGTSGDCRIEDVHGEVTVSSVAGDLTVYRIHGTVSCGDLAGDVNANEIHGNFSIGHAAGDLKAENIHGNLDVGDSTDGDVSIARIGGNATIGNVGGDFEIAVGQSVRVGDISGDLAARQLANALDVGEVSGDATLDHCGGPVHCGEVSGDLTARDLSSGLIADRVDGKAKLVTVFSPGQTYELNARGGATIVLAGPVDEASVTFDLRRTDGGHIDVRLPLQDRAEEPGIVRGRLGDGQAKVRVESEGSLRVIGSGRDERSEATGEGWFEGLGEEIRNAFSAFATGQGFDFDFEQRVRDHAEKVRERVEENARRAAEQAEQRVREATQRTAESVERQVRRATERAQRNAERAARGAERHGWSWNWQGQPFGGGRPASAWPTPPPPPAPPPRPRATEEERLAVLRMLSEGKITAEDASRLLEALGM
jgi:hypothetical protein